MQRSDRDFNGIIRPLASPRPSRLGKQVLFLAPRKSAAAGWDGWFDVAFGKALRAAGVRAVCWQPWNGLAVLGRVLRRAGVIRNLHTVTRRAYVVTLPSISEYKLLPATYFSEIIPYVYDCWPGRWGEWERFFRRHDVRIIFFSARQACKHFTQRLPGTDCIWMPEACDPQGYDRGKPLAQRSIDVNEFGRVFAPYHQAITPSLSAAGARHHATGGLSREAFLSTLADSKIAVCFPRSMTHPEVAGTVETVTLRYFECMASGSLLVGHCPQELLDLFGYNPVIEADLQQPAAQMRAILESIESYQPMVDRNYQQVLSRGSWETRVGEMLSILQARGYRLQRQNEKPVSEPVSHGSGR